jgi:hypothetical protein
MIVSPRWFFLMGFVPVLMGGMLIAGCSRLPWSKSKDKEPLPEGKTVYIEDLERNKGIEAPPQPDKGPQKSPADKGKGQPSPETKTREREAVALAPTAPADLTFSPVKGLEGLKRKICVVGFEDRTGPQTDKYGELATLRLLQELERTQKAVLVDKEVVWKALAREGIEPPRAHRPPCHEKGPSPPGNPGLCHELHIRSPGHIFPPCWG